MRDKLKKLWDNTGIYGVLAVIQYLAAVLFNFRYTKAAVDPDAAKLFRHAVEMSKNHSLWIPNWSNATTMEWDSAAILAAPMYSLTHNVYTAFALANSIILLFFLWLVYILFKRFEISTINIMKAYDLFLIPYAFGMLDYFNMLFFNGSQYIFRLIIPFTLLIIIKTPKEKRLSPLNIVLCAFEFIMMLIAASSSGTYILVSCAMPLTLLVIFDAVMSDDMKVYDLYQYLCCIIAMVCAGVGMILNKSIGGGEIGNTMSLLRWYDWRNYADAFVEGLFRVLGSMPGAIEGDDVAVMSLRGFAYLLKLLILAFVGLTFISGVKKTIFTGRKKTSETSVVQPDRVNNINYYLCGIALINMLMLMVCETRYSSLNSTFEVRYFLPAVVPVLLIVPLQIENWKNSWSKYLSNIFNVIFVVGILFVTVICYQDAHDALDEYAYCDIIIEYMEESGFSDAIFMNDRPTSECCRAKDLTRTYESYIPEYNSMDIVDFYNEAFEGSHYNDDHLLFVTVGSELEPYIGEDKAAFYEYRDSILWFDIYEAHEFILVP